MYTWFLRLAIVMVISLSTPLMAFNNSARVSSGTVNSILDQIDMDYVRQHIIDLTQCIGSVDVVIGSSDIPKPTDGTCTNNVQNVKAWRLGGSPDEVDVVNHLVNSFASILGGNAVTTEPVPVDMWRFLKASLTVNSGNGNQKFPAASIAGSSIIPTGAPLPQGCKTDAAGITCNYDLSGNLIWVNKGLASDYTNLSILDGQGKLPPNSIVFYSWDDTVDWASAQCYEAKARGAKAIVQTTLPEFGAFYYHEAQDGGGTFDFVGDGSSCPPMITLSARDARTILNVLQPKVLDPKSKTPPKPMSAQVKLDLQMKESTPKKPNYGFNVLAKIPGSEYPNEIIILSAHHDAYFEGALDDLAAHALMLGMAKAIKESGYVPKRTLLFVSVSSEEFGLFDSVYDWLTGSMALMDNHPEWSDAFNGGEYVVGEINVGDVVPAISGGVIQFSASNDLLDAANSWFSSLGKDIDPQLFSSIATYVDQYTYYRFGGIPTIGFDQYTLPYFHNHYHTDTDTINIIDFDKLKDVAKANLISALALDNAITLPYDYAKAIHRLKESLNLSTVNQLVKMGNQLGLDNCTDTSIDAKLNAILSNASNANAQLQNTKEPTDKPDIILTNQFLREASRIYSSLITSDGAITPETTFAHAPSEREVVNMNAAINALTTNTPRKALDALLKVTPYVNVFVTNFSQGAFNQRLSDYGKVTGVVGPNGMKAISWGRDSTPAYGFYTEYHSIKNKIAQNNGNFNAELTSIQTKRDNALNYYCGALNDTLQSATDLNTAINNAIDAATN